MCVGVLFLGLALPLFRGEVYLDSDLRRFYLPVRFFYQHALRTDGEFLWFPYEFAGFYLHGEGQAGLYHPLNLLSYRWLPLTLAFDLEVLRAYVFALLGAFLLLRRFELPTSAALLGAILFAFSSFQLLHFMHPNVVGAIAHLPWLLLALDWIARGEPSLGTALAAPAYALLTASQLLLGHPQAVWMSLCVELLFALLLLRHGARRGAFWRAGAAKALGVLAAAIQLLPTWDALQHSTRASASAEFSRSYGILPLDLVQLVQPYLFTGRVVGLDTSELAIYVGTVALLALAWFPLGRLEPGLPARLGRGALVLAVLGTWLALGAHGGLYSALAELPVIGLFRAPARYILFLDVASALAAALWFAHRLRREEARGDRAERALALSLVLLSAGLALAVLASIPRAAQGVGPAAIGVGLCAATAVLAWIAATRKTAALASLLAFACLDVGLYGLSYVRQRIPEPAPLSALLERFGAPPDASGFRKLNGHPEATISGVRFLWGYVALWPARQLPILPPDNISDERAMAAWRAALRVGAVSAKESPQPLPRVRLVTDALVSSEPARDIAAIDVETTALIDRAVELDAGQPGETRLLTESPGELSIETQTAGRQLLVVSESFHPGWRVWIDGTPRELLRAYGDFMGCVVPPGAHRIRLHFEPASFRRGARISAVALAVILLWAALAFARAGQRTRESRHSSRTDRPMRSSGTEC